MASPGVADMLKRWIVMSKSKSSWRALVLHGIDEAYARFDAERPEVLDVGRVVRLERGLVQQELDPEDLTVRQHPLAILDGHAGLG